MAGMHRSLNLVLLGKAGVGKSATGNTILGREVFISKKSFTSVTQEVAEKSSMVCGRRVTVYDTPGFLDSEESEEKIQQIYNVFQKCESHPCVFLLVIKVDRFTEGERKTVEKIVKVLGVKRKRKTWILFTRGDQLEEDDMTIEEFISDYEALKKLLQKFDQRYCVFNNTNSGHIGQVQELFTKILETNCYTTGATNVKQISPKMKAPKSIEPESPGASLSPRRIVLLGKSGFGRSSAGNTILGWKEFRCMRGMTPVTRECSVKHATVSGRSVTVVDTPGLYHTELNSEELKKEIKRSVYLSSPGPHAFLIVFRVDDRFTVQEKQIPQMIKMMFGEGVFKYSIILFTHGDQLDEETVETLMKKSSRLRDVVDQCGGRFHVFNNTKRNSDQVNDLLQKIDTMIEQNGGGHYSIQMYEDAERLRREEEERRQREEEERKQQEIEKAIQYTERRIRAEYEGPPRFLQERIKSMRLREEDWKRQRERRQFERERDFYFSYAEAIIKIKESEQKRKEIEIMIKETERRIREEFQGQP